MHGEYQACMGSTKQRGTAAIAEMNGINAAARTSEQAPTEANATEVNATEVNATKSPQWNGKRTSRAAYLASYHLENASSA